MIKKLFTGKIDSITIAALLVALSSLVSRFLGIFRDRILATEFGAGEMLDSYYAAFRIPDLIFNLIVLGALSAGFIPIFSKILKNPKDKLVSLFEKEGHESAWALANNVLNILGIALLVLSGIGIIFAPYITKLIAPGFGGEQLQLTIQVTRIMFLSPILLGLSSIFGGILQSFKRFFVYSLSPILYNVGIIVGAIYFVPIWGIYGLAWGVVLGALLHLLIQVPTAFSLGFRYKPIINLKDSNVRKIGVMMIPRTLSLGITQLNLLVITSIASTLVAGSLTVFNFANNLQSFPIGIFGISFAVAAFPTLSAIAFERKKMIENFSLTFRKILFFVVPASVLLLTLRAQIIRVILGAGQFDWQDTLMTIKTLGYFSVSIFAQATIPLLVRVFYARHNSSTPFIVGLISAVINIFLSILFARHYGVAGLALAFSVANVFNFIILWIVLRTELGDLDEFRILKSVIKFSASAIAAGLAVQGMKLVVWPYVDMTKVWGVFIQGFVAGASGIFTYIAFCSLLKCEELFNFWEAIKRRFPWRKISVGDQGEARGI